MNILNIELANKRIPIKIKKETPKNVPKIYKRDGADDDTYNFITKVKQPVQPIVKVEKK